MTTIEIRTMTPVVFAKRHDGTWNDRGKPANVAVNTESNTLTVDDIDYFVRTVNPMRIPETGEIEVDYMCVKRTANMSYATLFERDNTPGNYTDHDGREAHYSECDGTGWLHGFGSVQAVERYSRMGIVTIGFRN